MDRNIPEEGFGAERGRWYLGMVRNGDLPNVFPANGGGAWSGREEGLSPPDSFPGEEGARFARRRLMWADGDGGSEGRGN